MPQLVHWTPCQLESDLEGDCIQQNRQLSISTWAPHTVPHLQQIPLGGLWGVFGLFFTFYWIHAHMRTHNTALVKSQGTQWSADRFKYYQRVLSSGADMCGESISCSSGLQGLFGSSLDARECMLPKKCRSKTGIEQENLHSKWFGIWTQKKCDRIYWKGNLQLLLVSQEHIKPEGYIIPPWFFQRVDYRHGWNVNGRNSHLLISLASTYSNPWPHLGSLWDFLATSDHSLAIPAFA